jgi:sugar phosphate isomerase/epimerase
MEKFNNSRRQFIKTAGLSVAAISLTGFEFFNEKAYVPNIGIQLYSVRKLIEKDFEGTMKKIADLGYIGVETYPLPESITLQRAAGIFKNVGLKVIGIHSELPVGAQRDKALRMAEAYNCNNIVYPGGGLEGDRYKNLDAIKHTMEIYNETASILKSKGIRFGLHNHWPEFELTDGYYPFYYLLEHLNKEIFFEIDTYWAKTAGQNPAKVLKIFGKRAPFLHIKDGPAIKGDEANKQVPAGQGIMDFPSIVKAGGTNIKWMIVEFDEYSGDIIDGIKSSYEFLTENKLAKGKLSALLHKGESK